MKHRTRDRLTDKEKKKILKLHKQGVKIRFIAERFGVCKSTIGNVVRKWQEREIDNGYDGS